MSPKEEKKAHLPSLRAYGLPTFYGVFQDLQEQCADLWQHWGSDTLSQYDAHICRTIVPNLKDHDQRPIRTYTREEMEELLKKLQKSGQYEEVTVQKFRHIIRTVITVGALNSLCPDLFSGLEREKRSAMQIEGKTPRIRGVVPRSLDPMQEVRVRRWLMENIKTSNAAAGLFLMYYCGLRNQEACGANFSSIRELEGHPGNYVLIIPESVKSGTNQSQIGGKTYNSGRRIYLPEEAVRILLDLRQHRIQWLTERRRSIPEKLPIVCEENDPAKRCRSTALTAAARAMFLQTGVHGEDLDALAEELWRESELAREQLYDDEFRLIEKEPTAYLLRRHYATLLEMLNLTENEKQYLMGHRMEDESTVRTDYQDEKLLWTMIEKLKRRPLAEPEPGETVCDEAVTCIRSGSGRIRIPAGAGRVSLNVFALEPNTPIHICVERKGETRAEYGMSWMEAPPLPSQALYMDPMIRKVYRQAREACPEEDNEKQV